MLCAVWNCITIPMIVAFPESFFTHLSFTIFDWVVDVIFLLDIIVNFRTTYLNTKTGDEVINGWMIARNYLKTRFIVDLLATIPFDTIGNAFISKENTQLLEVFGLLKLV